MILLSLRKIVKAYKDKTILKEINLDVKQGEILGLVGMNGAGKTTLMNIVMNEETADSGTIEKLRETLRIGYLRQDNEYENMDHLYNDKTELQKYLKYTSDIGLNKVNNWSVDRFTKLSGGEKTKLRLVELFKENYDLLLLDEPTNHLDYVGIEWLIDQIKQSGVSFIIISHDRYFLDKTVDKIAELDHGVMEIYHGNYTFYRKEKQKKFKSLMHQYDEQKKIERHIEDEIGRLKKWAHLAHRDSTKHDTPKEYWRSKAKAKDKQIKQAIRRKEKMIKEGVKRPEEEKNIYFAFQGDKNHGKRILVATQLTKHYPNKTLFKDSNFYLSRGEKIGLVGINGCGKTTLIRMMLGNDKAFTGELWISPSIKIAYLSQDEIAINMNRTIEEIISNYDREHQTKARLLFAQIGLTSDLLCQEISTFSLGERVRLKLVLLILEENNVLILDEPTNHLDLHSREQLEKTLEAYTGTIIIASHDRYLLEKITDKLLIFENETIQRIEMGLKEYSNKETIQKSEYDLILINHQISSVLAKLCEYKKTDVMYEKLEEEYQTLLKQKRFLQNKQ